jgi:hypothetical protein
MRRAGNHERVRKAVHMHAVHGHDAVFPFFRQLDAIAPDHVHRCLALVIRADFKARREDQAVEFVVFTADDHAVFDDALHAFAIGVDQRHVWQVERVEVLIMEAGPFAKLVDTRASAHCAATALILDDLVDASTRTWIPSCDEVGEFRHLRQPLRHQAPSAGHPPKPQEDCGTHKSSRHRPDPHPDGRHSPGC